MTLPFGIDVSFWQESIDFDKMMKAPTPPLFIGIRAGQGNYAIDPYFGNNWQKAKEKSLFRIAYHVIEFGVSGKLQAELLFERARKFGYDPGVDKLCLDVELNRNYSRYLITSVTLEAINRLKTLTGVYPLMYSRASWINSYLDVSRLPRLDWWLAGYLKRLPSPFFTKEMDSKYLLIPNGVDGESVKIHQTGDRSNGKPYGVKSYYLDTNRFLGTVDELRTWFGSPVSEPEPEPEPPIVVDPDNPLYRIKVTEWATPYVNLRSEPRISKDTDIGDIYPNEIANVLEEREVSKMLWLRTDRGWLMAKYTERVAGVSEPGHVEGLLVVPHYSQNDLRWKNNYLGFSKTTIGDFGCLITGLAAYLTYLGIPYNPGTLNEILIQRYGFVENRLYWQMPRQLWGVEKPEDFYFSGGTGFESKLDGILADERPALAMVDFIPGGAFNQHWVLILGKVNGVYYLLDTWDGTVQALHAKYHKIFRLVGYKR
jgi:hypothetical protein